MEVKNHAFYVFRAFLKPSFSDEIKGGYMIFVIFGGPRKSIQKLIKIWPKTGQKLARTWPKPGQNLARTCPEVGQDLPKNRPEIDQKVIKIVSKSSSNSHQKWNSGWPGKIAHRRLFVVRAPRKATPTARVLW